MNHAKILDCTLRDGAYLLDKNFGETVIKGIIRGLLKSKVDIIEIGFFQDEGFGDGKTVFKNSEHAKSYIPKDKHGCMFTVLADYSRYSVSNLDQHSDYGVDAIRECFFKHERFDALKNCKVIQEKGYKCFVQPVDILGYSDLELIEFLNLVNEIEPYCLSIVDTFGSMYQEDLHRVFEIINHNLTSTCKIGFHSHNNMQMSNALSQEFVRMTYGKREVIVDATISGMGRGAGNTPTELIAQYMVSKLGYNYNIDSLLDVIDDYMDGIRARCSWGYSTSFFVAGSYSAHVNNISYLTEKNSIRSKDIRYILNTIGPEARKRYDYNLLESTYLDYLKSEIDDSNAMRILEERLNGRNVLLLLPGQTAISEEGRIIDCIKQENAVVISINYIHENIYPDYVYMSNKRRYSIWKENPLFIDVKKILASNVKETSDNDKELIVSFKKLIKCGWNHVDNSGIMALRLLDELDVKSILIAGFDGYSFLGHNQRNYACRDMEIEKVRDNPGELNDEISSMLTDYVITRKREAKILFVTNTRFINTTPIEMWESFEV